MTKVTVELKKLDGPDRMGFLPMLFGPNLYLKGESVVYGFTSKFCDEYKGGYWTYIELQNGGGFMYPEMGSETVTMQVASNGFHSSAISPIATGIICTMYALSHLCADHPYSSDLLAKRYHQLYDFVLSHPESEIIFAAID